jgi:hypothetical protein
LIRLLLPLAGVCAFFAASWITVRVFRPREPRRFFLLYALLLVVASSATYVWLWPLVRIEDILGLACCVLLQTLVCLTMWNAFYSLLWGFSGSLMYDIFTNERLRTREHLVRSYEGDDGLDRILARRLPNLVRGGWIEMRGTTLRLTSKGRLIAIGTLAAFKMFSLGMGGGIKEK